jgi:hypothetical protein
VRACPPLTQPPHCFGPGADLGSVRVTGINCLGFGRRTLTFVWIGHHVLWKAKEYMALQPYLPHTPTDQLDADLLRDEGDARNNHWDNLGMNFRLPAPG